MVVVVVVVVVGGGGGGGGWGGRWAMGSSKGYFRVKSAVR